MSKRAIPGKRPEIALDQNASISLYKQLYERLRSEILTGQLEAGTRLPSTRVLSSELGVSRNTTALAYEMLLLEGYIESRVGDGTRVAHLQSEQSFIGDQHTTDSSETPQAVLARAANCSSRGLLQKNSLPTGPTEAQACSAPASQMWQPFRTRSGPDW
ncbi:GntR family transcriptional regulator [Ktedonobacter racemifer]|uniref:GntR family transcriptional regulator n=1 Tax=Ktedonobacter racemifer TaxID=363277 RepID=UPI000696CC64|nr:winged helix-turn-helix domain-containing protein [Ktedonobacter racemifer]